MLRLPVQKTKTRKPYTITKPRQSWSNEEHALFLEALELYERDWKKIGNHVKTKTVIQIRSHAQKHFLKLQKLGEACAIPPPRPKRKASDGSVLAKTKRHKSSVDHQHSNFGSVLSTPGPVFPRTPAPQRVPVEWCQVKTPSLRTLHDSFLRQARQYFATIIMEHERVVCDAPPRSKSRSTSPFSVRDEGDDTDEPNSDMDSIGFRPLGDRNEDLATLLPPFVLSSLSENYFGKAPSTSLSEVYMWLEALFDKFSTNHVSGLLELPSKHIALVNLLMQILRRKLTGQVNIGLMENLYSGKATSIIQKIYKDSAEAETAVEQSPCSPSSGPQSTSEAELTMLSLVAQTLGSLRHQSR